MRDIPITDVIVEQNKHQVCCCGGIEEGEYTITLLGESVVIVSPKGILQTINYEKK
jgi:hypothetical protein